jgi:hypothetical protein
MAKIVSECSMFLVNNIGLSRAVGTKYVKQPNYVFFNKSTLQLLE